MPIEPSDPTDVPAARSRLRVAIYDLGTALARNPYTSIALGFLLTAALGWGAWRIQSATVTTSTTITTTVPADADAP